MVILGVDPGIARTGWGAIEKQGSKTKALEYGCFETASTDELPKRLIAIRKHILSLVKKYKPEALGIEELFFNTNAKTAMIVGQARGVVIEAAAESNIKVVSFTPPEIKTAITGYGKAEKEQIGKMVKMLLGLPEIPKLDDTCDALACALACAFSKK